MKNMYTKRNTIIFMLAIMLTFSGCQAMRGWFSKGKGDLRTARSHWNDNRYVESLIYATQALITDPDYFQGKNFINDRFDKGIELTKQRIAVLGTPDNSKDAEELYQIYVNLVKLYNSVEKMGLPVVHHKEKWSWTTEIVDYRSKRQEAFVHAFNLLMKEGRDFLAAGNIQNAEVRFQNVVRNYAESNTVKDSLSMVIADEFVEWADEFTETPDIQKAKTAFAAYTSATRFVTNHLNARAGIDHIKLHISGLFVKRGEDLEKKRGVDNLIAASAAYDRSLHWNSQNKEASENKKRIVVEIAEHYYAVGVRAQDQQNNPAQAKTAFVEAQKWVADYKDTNQRIYVIDIVAKLDGVNTRIASTTKEYNNVATVANRVSGSVKTGNDAVNAIDNVRDKVEKINNVMGYTARTLESFNSIPKLGFVTSATAHSIKLARTPIQPLNAKMSALNNPVIRPAKTTFNAMNNKVGNMQSHFKKSQDVLTRVKSENSSLPGKITPALTMDQLKAIDSAVDAIIASLNAAENDLKIMNTHLGNLNSNSQEIAKINQFVTPVSRGLDDLDKILSSLQPGIDGINSFLDRNFGNCNIYCLSARDILEGVGRVTGPLMSMVDDALKPVLANISAQIPPIPGTEQLTEMMDDFKKIYDELKKEYEAMESAFASYNQNIENVEKNLEILESNLDGRRQRGGRS